MQLHTVDFDTCRGDDICAEVCPENVLEMVEGKAATVESRADSCILCGQCVAVCPTGSIHLTQLPEEDFQELPAQPFGYGDLHDFLKRRRSIRVFKNRPVAPEEIERANDEYHRDGTDRYMYHAPVLLLFHGSRWAMSYAENAHLVCHHAMLAAVSLGFGTTIIGLIPPVVDHSKALRKRYGIPKDNKVLTSLIVGHPKYRYKKSIRRDLAGVRLN